jgi:hypothetical protein
MKIPLHILPTAVSFLCLTVSAETVDLPCRTGFRIEKVAEFARPAEPKSLSAAATVSNGVYWTATDWNSQIWEMRLENDASGIPCRCNLRALGKPECAMDVEGLAYDPADGSVWIADEHDATVKQYNAYTGKCVAQAEVPPSLKNFRRHTGLESLAISRDGREMWTCTEEAVVGDGSRSTRKSGTDVRLTRLIRSNGGVWKADGQWAYRTDSIVGGAYFNKHKQDISRSGVSALCMPMPGVLLVLEREFSKVFLPRFRCRIYAVDLTGAANVLNVARLEDVRDIKRAKKKLLYETSGFSMYEGMCADPLEDGSFRLVLVSDGDKRTLRTVLVLKLSAERQS